MPRLVVPAVDAESITRQVQPTLDMTADVHLRPWRTTDREAVIAGFALEGTRRHALKHADGWHDLHVHVRLSRSVPEAHGDGAP